MSQPNVYTKGPNSIVRPIKDSIRKQVRARRIRMEDFFCIFDIHKTKKITVGQFSRALDMAGVQASEADINLLCQRYAADDRGEDVYYARFCDQIDKVFTRKGLEAKPTFEVTCALDTTTRSFGQTQSMDAEVATDAALLRVQSEVSVRGLIVKDFFKDFDRHNSGFVTEQRFLRGLYRFAPNLSEGDVQLLRMRYSDGQDVNYRSFHADVTKQMGGDVDGGKNWQHSRESSQQPLSPRELAQAEERVVAHVRINRVRLKEFFRDYDKLRKSRVTAPQFKSVLTGCGLPLNSRELGSIAEHYGIRGQAGPLMVDYAAFCASLEAAELAAVPPAPGSGRQGGAVPLVPSSPHRQRASSGANAEYEDLMESLRQLVTNKRLQLKDKFADFDRQREQSCSFQQFCRTLAVMGVSLSPKELRLLADAHPHTSGGLQRVDYVRFLAALMPAAPAETSNQAQSAGGWQHTRAPPPRATLESSLQDVKARVLARRLRAEDFFVDSDKHKRGTVTRQQFFAGLGALAPELSTEQTACLAEGYAAGDGSVVDWKRFTRDVDSVFTVRELEAAPCLDVANATMRARGAYGDDGGNYVSSDVANSAEAQQLLGEVKLLVQTHRMLLTPFFTDFDSHRRGILPASQFMRSLTLAFGPAALNESKLKLLADAYTVPGGGVCYKNFCADMQSPEDRAKPAIDKLASDFHARPNGGMVDPCDDANTDAVLAKLSAYAATRRIRVVSFLQDYDRLRHGHVAEAKFFTAVDNAFHMTLTPREQRGLARRFASTKAPNSVDWHAFAAAVDGEDPGLEQSPRKSLSRRGAGPVWTERDTDVDQDALDELLLVIQGQINTARLHVKAFFQNYDKHNNGSVTRGQFCSVLEFSRILPSHPSKVELLLQAFALPDAPDRVNYSRFCVRVNSTSS